MSPYPTGWVLTHRSLSFAKVSTAAKPRPSERQRAFPIGWVLTHRLLTLAAAALDAVRGFRGPVRAASVALWWVKTHPMRALWAEASVGLRWVKTHPMRALWVEASVALWWVKTHPMGALWGEASVVLRWVKTHPMRSDALARFSALSVGVREACKGIPNRRSPIGWVLTHRLLTLAAAALDAVRGFRGPVRAASVALWWVKTHPMRALWGEASVELRWVKTHPMGALRSPRA